MAAQVSGMIGEAVACEVQFAEDLLGQAVAGLPPEAMRQYLKHVADRRLAQLGIPARYGSPNPLAFMDLQDVQELSNFMSPPRRGRMRHRGALCLATRYPMYYTASEPARHRNTAS